VRVLDDRLPDSEDTRAKAAGKPIWSLTTTG